MAHEHHGDEDCRVDHRRRGSRAAGERIESRNPANLEDVVCEAVLGDAATFVDACRAARAAQRDWAAVPAPVRGNGDPADRAARRGQQGGARPGSSRARSASPTPSRSARSRRSSTPATSSCREGRRLYGQTVPSEMPDKQLFTFRNPVGVAAIITAGNFPVAVPSWYLVPGDPVRERGRLEAGRVLAGARRRARPAVHRGRPAGRRPQPRPVRRPDRLRGPRAGARRGARRQGRLHGVVGGRLADRRAHAAATSSRPASSSAARTRSS